MTNKQLIRKNLRKNQKFTKTRAPALEKAPQKQKNIIIGIFLS